MIFEFPKQFHASFTFIYYYYYYYFFVFVGLDRAESALSWMPDDEVL
jgi:hypothetical protein